MNLVFKYYPTLDNPGKGLSLVDAIVELLITRIT